MPIERVLLTYADYLAMPDDGRRYEILDGEVAVSATPATRHQRTVGNLDWVLRRHVEPRGLGEVFLAPLTVILANTTVVEPEGQVALSPFPELALVLDELWRGPSGAAS